MERRLVSLLGTSAKHILTAVERAFRAVAITGVITFLIVLAGAEGVGYALTKQLPPSGPTHLASAALAVAFAYAAAITVAVGEILRAIIKTIELIVAESEKLAGEAIREGEHLAREGLQEAERLGHAAVGEAGALGRGAVGEVGTLGREVAGVAGGVGAAIGRDVHGIESHLPGHHAGAAGSGSNEPSSGR
jgi:hypothetical protein